MVGLRELRTSPFFRFLEAKRGPQDHYEA